VGFPTNGRIGGVRPGKQGGVHGWTRSQTLAWQAVYPPCTPNWRFGRFYRFCRFVKSISYMCSTSTQGSNPTLSASHNRLKIINITSKREKLS
jgi:hypothetical protein